MLFQTDLEIIYLKWYATGPKPIFGMVFKTIANVKLADRAYFAIVVAGNGCGWLNPSLAAGFLIAAIIERFCMENEVETNENTTTSVAEEYADAHNYSSYSIGFYLLTVVIYNIFIHHIVSFSTLVLFFPGIFILSFGGYPILQLRHFKERILTNPRFDAKPQFQQTLILILFTPTVLFELAYPFLAGLLAAYFLRGF